ncbi:MAG TPA: 1-deoxy-D-xylulose-5-phosphate reductoisomerase, partial [Candidatus Dormibacteraeota bacterium]|nr:1-deoxy-D-xylulose-5-phosphate reductoisomerase [Candidatus Dormibacteraeota bacterium]
VLNAANEIAVQLFVAGQLRFDQIVPLVERVLAQHKPSPATSIAALMEADAWARQEARSVAGRAAAARS